MSTARLTFLYPPLFRSPQLSLRWFQCLRQKSANFRQQSQFRCLCLYPRTGTRASSCQDKHRKGARSGSANIFRSRFRSSRSFSIAEKRQERHIKRHGKAVEPLLPNADGEKADGGNQENGGVFESGGKSTGVEGKGDEGAKEGQKGLDKEKEKAQVKEPSSSAALSEETQNAAQLPGDESFGSGSGSGDKQAATGKQNAVSGKPEPTSPAPSTKSTSTTANPLETVLHMPPAETAEEENASKPPHLQTPPYVHHFDTYTLVQQVEAGGFSNEQAITSMKAVRGLLALNLEVARKGLVSKSDVENETYLFRAACSELKTEIQNTRKKNEEAMRRERTLLQHEVEILNQKLSQELLTLKDDLKGMFDDRKMSVRMEQRTMESKIQELNYKITVLLNSDSKSEIEGLRWVLTRRSVMGILFMAFMVLTSLRYASYKTHEDDHRAQKKEEVTLKADNLTSNEMAAQGAAEILAAN